MGSIQGLRSWALATRANEDTDVQVSGFLGSVNKSLGKQIVDMIDQLQGVIGERTKAYNDLVASLNKTVDGKDGIGSKSILAAMGGIKVVGALMGLVTNSEGATATAGLAVATNLVQNFFTGKGLESTINSAVYDYERMASQLGYMVIEGPVPGGNTADEKETFKRYGLNSGASKFLDMRDALMPRYNKAKTSSGYIQYPLQGYVGTLRRLQDDGK